ncbi:single-stranded DNA-binding protein [Enterococcus hirae]|nr:single-stranded DNA-binding protein [Enterococcus hirae]
MINNVTLVGRLTKDPDLRYTASGTAVATFTLAVNRNFTNQNGNREADFINCVIWRKPAETMATLAKKGSLIGVVGRIQTRTYDNQQGHRVYVTEVVADNFQLLESKAATEAVRTLINRLPIQVPLPLNNGIQTMDWTLHKLHLVDNQSILAMMIYRSKQFFSIGCIRD